MLTCIWFQELTQTTGFEISPAQLADKDGQVLQLPDTFHCDHALFYSDQQLCFADPTGKPNISHPRAFLYSMPKGVVFSFLFFLFC